MPTIFDVAAAAGVSHQTVSRVVNGDPSVRDATRERVEAAIRALGYRRNAAARALASRRTRTIGLLVVGLPLYGPSSTTSALNSAARAGGWDVSIEAVDRGSADELRQAADALLGRDVAALVVVAPSPHAFDALADLRIDVPLLVTLRSSLPGAYSVSIDSTSGARLAVEHLAALGHRVVAHVAGPADWIEAVDREQGWRAACVELGVQAPEPLRGDWTAATAFALGERLVADGVPSAVFAANDQTALGLASAFAAAGLRIPDDVSIVGFDDIPEAQYFVPALTTVRQDFHGLGERLMARLDALLGGGDGTRATLLPTRLVERGSTRAV